MSHTPASGKILRKCYVGKLDTAKVACPVWRGLGGNVFHKEQRAALPPYATLLLNAGAPVLSVQALLGHEKVDTTLGYARLYDGTIAADYYRAMGQVEHLLELPESVPFPITTPAKLVALLDSLGSVTLNDQQRETVQALRVGIFSLALARKTLSSLHPR